MASVKKAIPGSLSPRILYPICLYFWNHASCGHLSEGYIFFRLNLEMALVTGGVPTPQPFQFKVRSQDGIRIKK